MSLLENNNNKNYQSITNSDSNKNNNSSMSAAQDNNPTSMDTGECGLEAFLNRNYFASKLIPNTGSVARDHLANERTFLAWLRTSLALVTMGIAISQLGNLTNNPGGNNKGGITLGSVYICVGMLFIVVGVSRYFYIQNQLIKNMFPAARYTVLLGVALLGLVIGTLLVTIFLDLA